MLALIGGNGVGKSTLVKLISGSLESSEVVVDHPGTLGVVYQNPDQQLFTPTVFEELAWGPCNLNLPRQEVYERVETLLREFDLWDIRDKDPFYLSGGQKQKVVILAALACGHKNLIFDEATSMLDAQSRWQLLDFLTDLIKRYELSVLWVTHHADELSACDALLALLAQGTFRFSDICEFFVDQDLFQECGFRLSPYGIFLNRIKNKLSPELFLQAQRSTEAVWSCYDNSQ